MSRRRRATLSPTLFPFLAVLICTLGTLILLLALVAQKADETAEQAAQEKAADRIDARQAIAKQQWLRAELVSMRDQQTAVLERRRSALAHLEERQREIRKELKRLQSEIEAAEQPAVDTAEQQTVISALQEQIKTERERLEKAKTEASGRRPRVIITAHEGPYGTARRPVYVECSGDAIVLQPEGSRIERAQLAGALGPGNPLDAALRAIRLHWQKTEPESPAPYPLLVVRPDGIATYAAARKAMASWDDQFGYELIPEELELAFPDPDQRLRHEIDVAIREATTRQKARIASAKRNRSFRRGQPPVLSAAALSRGGSDAGRRHFNRTVDPRSPGAGSGVHPDDIRDFDDAMRAAAGSSTFGSSASPASGSAESGAFSSPNEHGGRAAAGQQNVAGAQGNNQAEAFGASGPFDGAESSGETGSSNEQGTADSGSRSSRSNPTSGQTGSGGPNAIGSAAPPANNGGDSNGSADQPPLNANRSVQQQSDSDQQLRREGPQWALPDSVKRIRGSAIERRIEVICRTDALVIAPERAGLAAREFPIRGGSVEQAAMGLATVVHDRVASWGVALASGRWQPILRVAVQPGAESQFHQLQALLDGSGLKIERR